MPIILKDTPVQQIPPGTYLAVCYRIVDLGTQTSEMYGDKRKLVISWELPHERITIEGEEKPMSTSEFYSLTFGPKSKLRQHLKAWRGREFTPEELDRFELKSILGKGCQLSIVHNEKGKATVDGVVALLKGQAIPTAFNPLVEYSIDDGKNHTFDKLPEWLQKMCSACLEWTGGLKAEAPEPDTEIPPNDDCPF